MRTSITVTIPEPCHEDWNKMTPREQGRHCRSCNKTVIDFTSKTDEQIIKIFKAEGKLCGRFKRQQLDREIVLARKDKNNYLSWVASGIFAFLAFGNQDVYAQGAPKTVKVDSVKAPQIKGKIARSILNEKMITGTVTTASDGLPLPRATVLIKGTTRGVQTDFDGNYKLKVKMGETLVFSFISFDTQEITINESTVVNVSLVEGNLLEEVVVGGVTSHSCSSSDYEFYGSGGVYFSRTNAQENWLTRNKQYRAKMKAERKAKREAIRNGKQERTLLGKFLFGIKKLFTKN